MASISLGLLQNKWTIWTVWTEWTISGPPTEVLTKLELRASRQDWGKNDNKNPQTARGLGAKHFCGIIAGFPLARE